MDAGYRILLERNEAACAHDASPLGVVQPSLLPISDDQFSDHALLNQVAEEDKVHETGLNHTVSNVKGKVAPGKVAPCKAAPVKSLLQSTVLPLMIFLVLVPGFLLFVDHVRRDDNRTERTNWRGQDLAGRDAERPEAITDAAGSDPLPPVVAVSSDPVGVAKCEGWRDWIDYEGGWKGCVP